MQTVNRHYRRLLAGQKTRRDRAPCALANLVDPHFTAMVSIISKTCSRQGNSVVAKLQHDGYALGVQSLGRKDFGCALAAIGPLRELHGPEPPCDCEHTFRISACTLA